MNYAYIKEATKSDGALRYNDNMGIAGRNEIKTARWRRLRAAILRRDGYQCQLSKRYGKHIEAEMVHHIFPRDSFPEYAWEPWNLISLSQEAHNTLHDRLSGELTAAGVELLIRTARKEGIPIPLRYQQPPAGF